MFSFKMGLFGWILLWGFIFIIILIVLGIFSVHSMMKEEELRMENEDRLWNLKHPERYSIDELLIYKYDF